MSQTSPTPGQPNPLPSTSVNPKGKASTLEMVTQDKQFQSERSRDGKVDCQNQGKANLVKEEETEGEEMSIKGTLLSQDVRAVGWCPEEESVVSIGYGLGLERSGDKASHASMSGSLRSGHFERNPRNVADGNYGDIQDLEKVQENLSEIRISDNISRGPAAGEPVIWKDDQLSGQTKEGHCKSLNVGVSERSGHSPTATAGKQKTAVTVPPIANMKIGDGGGKTGGEQIEGGGGDPKKELETSFSMQSSVDSQQLFSQENDNKQSLDNVRNLDSTLSEPSMATSQYSSPSSSKFTRSRSLEISCKNEHYDLLLIYTKEDESTYAKKFREYADSKDWKVTSTAELPIGALFLTNFSKAMECSSYVVLLISSNFLLDKACERHYNTAIQYGDKHPKYTSCVLPILFDSVELPPELDAIQHVTWGTQYFDKVMGRSVDVQKRLDREQREYAAATSLIPQRAISIDACLSTTSTSKMATTPSALGTVPARIPMHGTDSYQTSAAAQQPPVQRVPEQEACLMPSGTQSTVLPSIPVPAASNMGVTQNRHPGVAATTAGNQAQHGATCGTQLRTTTLPTPSFDGRSATGKFGALGGKLYTKSHGFTLHIPPGALEEDEKISLHVLTEIPNSLKLKKDELLISHGFQCYPFGLRFKKPAKLIIPHCALVTAPNKVQTKLYSWNQSGTPERISDPYNIICSVQERWLEVSISHFSGGFFAVFWDWLFLKGMLLSCMSFLPRLLPPSRKPILEVRFVKKPHDQKWNDVHALNHPCFVPVKGDDDDIVFRQGTLTVACQLGEKSPKSDVHAIQYSDMRSKTKMTEYFTLDLTEESDETLVTLQVTQNSTQTIKFNTRFQGIDKETTEQSTLSAGINEILSDEQKVTDANILKLATLLPPNLWSPLHVALRIDYSTAEGIRERFREITEQYIHLLQTWKAASTRTIKDLNTILNQAEAGGLVDKYLN